MEWRELALHSHNTNTQPCIWALYTLSYLDRANIGNAKTGGLEEDFQLTSTQYSICLLVFFISYVLFEVSHLAHSATRPAVNTTHTRSRPT